MIVKIKTMPMYMGLFLLFLLCIACNGKKIILTPLGYDFSKPQKVNLGPKLDEISGICWVSDSLMIANNDESGRIFAINLMSPGDGAYNSVKFGEKDDYEDLVKVDSVIYVLQSSGKILKVTGYTDEATISSSVVGTLPGKENEFETLYYDKEVNSLIMLCKDCHKEKNRIRSAYRFDLSTNKFIDTPYYQIQMADVAKALKSNEFEFRPSAAAVNPADNRVYIVSPIGDLMVVISKKGKVEQAFGISTILFPQPEGITFARNGDMYVSNEILTEPSATLLLFKYNRP